MGVGEGEGPQQLTLAIASSRGWAGASWSRAEEGLSEEGTSSTRRRRLRPIPVSESVVDSVDGPGLLSDAFDRVSTAP